MRIELIEVGRTLLVALALLRSLAGCERDKPRPPPQDTVRMQIGSRTYTLEVAATQKSQQLGLMHRRSLPVDRGMIFVFPQEEQRSFWMKNTHIPLDILYLDAAGKVVTIRQMEPLDETSVPSHAPAKYAIELNRGSAEQTGVRIGDKLTIPVPARNAADAR